MERRDRGARPPLLRPRHRNASASAILDHKDTHASAVPAGPASPAGPEQLPALESVPGRTRAQARVSNILSSGPRGPSQLEPGPKSGPSSGSESDGNKCTPRAGQGSRPFEDCRRTCAAQRARPPSASRRPGDRADRAPGPPRSCPDADADASRSHRTRWPGVTRCHVILSYLNHD